MKLKIDNLSYSFLNTKVFSNYNLDIKTNESLCFIGSTGSGKSTLADLLVNIKRPNKGSIMLNNNYYSRFKKIKKDKISLILQNSNNQMFLHRVYDDIMLGIKNSNINEDMAKIKLKNLLNVFELEEAIINKNYANLSGGELKKISIISILILEPDIIIFDEPTIGLDYNSKINLISILKKFHIDNNIEYIFITHDPLIIKEFGHTIVKLQDGKNEFIGSYSEFEFFCKTNNYIPYLDNSDIIINKFNRKYNKNFFSLKEIYDFFTSR